MSVSFRGATQPQRRDGEVSETFLRGIEGLLRVNVERQSTESARQ
jgi:hypothetical protein